MGTSGPSTKDVTIPYWDWTVKPSGSRFPKAFEDSGSPLFDNSRITTPVTAPLYDKPTIFGVINSNTTWPGFAGGPTASPFYGAIESPYHNNMHSLYVSGDMSDPSFAALDPIFWSFHAYIDLIWDRWQSIHKIDPTCLDCPLRGLPAEKTAKDLIHVDTQLGYFYTENAGLGVRLEMAPMALAVPRAEPPGTADARLRSFMRAHAGGGGGGDSDDARRLCGDRAVHIPGDRTESGVRASSSAAGRRERADYAFVSGNGVSLACGSSRGSRRRQCPEVEAQRCW